MQITIIGAYLSGVDRHKEPLTWCGRCLRGSLKCRCDILPHASVPSRVLFELLSKFCDDQDICVGLRHLPFYCAFHMFPLTSCSTGNFYQLFLLLSPGIHIPDLFMLFIVSPSIPNPLQWYGRRVWGQTGMGREGFTLKIRSCRVGLDYYYYYIFSFQRGCYNGSRAH